MNLTIEQREQQILATIISCKKVIHGNDANVEQDVKLFESVTGAYGQISNEAISQINAVPYENFQRLGDNKFAYLKSVKEFVYGKQNDDVLRPLYESFDFDPFKEDLEKLILELEKDNAFNTLDFVDKQILQTKIFSKSPISVLGYNIMQTINTLKNSSDLQGVFSILFNKSTKSIYFVRKGEIFTYDIKTNEFNILRNEHLNAENYMRVISQQITANIVEIYENPILTIPNLNNGFTDNLFHDKMRTKELSDYKNEISFIKR